METVYGSGLPHYYADETTARLDLVAEVRTGAMHPTVAESKLRQWGIPCSRAARKDFREAWRAWRIGQIERSGRVGLVLTDEHGSWAV